LPDFLLVVFIPYLLLNYYVGRRLWQYLVSHRRPAGRRSYWLVFWLVALTPLSIDHQPYDFTEAAGPGVDLQVSGHTHVGQMFPNNLVTRRLFETDWGLLHKGDYHVIVPSVYGTWGPPIRVGNRPEIVEINIKFAP
jgi:hypothetical protein